MFSFVKYFCANSTTCFQIEKKIDHLRTNNGLCILFEATLYIRFE